MKISSSVVRLIAVAAMVLAPIAARAQEALAAADAAPFLGTWTLTLDSPQGPFEQQLVLKTQDGKIAGEMSSQMMPGTQEVTDITKSGSDLVLKFTGDFQGQAFNAKITMTPDGTDKAKVVFDVMDGQFMMTGAGAKKQ